MAKVIGGIELYDEAQIEAVLEMAPDEVKIPAIKASSKLFEIKEELGIESLTRGTLEDTCKETLSDYHKSKVVKCEMSESYQEFEEKFFDKTMKLGLSLFDQKIEGKASRKESSGGLNFNSVVEKGFGFVRQVKEKAIGTKMFETRICFLDSNQAYVEIEHDNLSKEEAFGKEYQAFLFYYGKVLHNLKGQNPTIDVEGFSLPPLSEILAQRITGRAKGVLASLVINHEHLSDDCVLEDGQRLVSKIDGEVERAFSVELWQRDSGMYVQTPLKLGSSKGAEYYAPLSVFMYFQHLLNKYERDTIIKLCSLLMVYKELHIDTGEYKSLSNLYTGVVAATVESKRRLDEAYSND